MDEQFVSLRSLVLASLLSVVFVTYAAVRLLGFSGSTIVFCDVGQGDAAYIRTLDGVDLLIDAGPSGEVLQCLGQHMPFWDRNLEAVFITHPQKDHYGGLSEILDRYTVETVFTVPIGSSAQTYSELVAALKNKNTDVQFLYAGDTLKIDSQVQVFFLWPTHTFTNANSTTAQTTHTPDNAQVLGTTITDADPNSFSQIFLLSQGSFDVLFTGDATPGVLAGLTTVTGKLVSATQDGRIEVIKVPHHGSKNGLTQGFLRAVSPMIAIVSASYNNPFGHPSRKVVTMLEGAGARVLTTAQEGSIVMWSDGQELKLTHPGTSVLLRKERAQDLVPQPSTP